MPWWGFVVAGAALCVYQAWAIGIRVVNARGLGFLLGVVLIVAGVARSG